MNGRLGWFWKESLDRLDRYLASVQEKEETMSETKTMTTDESTFVFSRTFDAPRDLVWKSWTEADRLMQWWGPKGFTMKVARLDLRPEGTFHYCLESPEGHEMWGKFVYKVIEKPSRLDFVVSFSDAEGGTTRHPMSEEWPLEVYGTMTLTERNGRTTIDSKSWPINAAPNEVAAFIKGHRSMEAGYNGTLDQLAEYLARP